MRAPRKQANRLIAIRLRYSINAHLDDQGITTPSDIARADRLGLNVDLEGLDPAAGKEGAR